MTMAKRNGAKPAETPAAAMAAARRVEATYTRDQLFAVKPSPHGNKARTISDVQLRQLCVVIVEFGLVLPFVVRGEDDSMMGGHQRRKAVEKLLSGPFTYVATDGVERTVNWEFPATGVQVTRLYDLTDEQARILTLALNKAGGDWDHDALAEEIAQLSKQVPNIGALAATGFSPTELTDYIDIAAELAAMGPAILGDGSVPLPTQKAPSIAFDFSTRELRDAVKAAVGALCRGSELSGDALARALGVKASKRPKKAAKKGASQTN